MTRIPNDAMYSYLNNADDMSSTKLKCIQCGNEDPTKMTYRLNGPHISAFCPQCHRFIKNVSKSFFEENLELVALIERANTKPLF